MHWCRFVQFAENGRYSFQLCTFTWLNSFFFSPSADIWRNVPLGLREIPTVRGRKIKQHIYRSHVRAVLQFESNTIKLYWNANPLAVQDVGLLRLVSYTLSQWKSVQNQPTRKTLNCLTLSVLKLPLFQIQHNVSGQQNTYWFCGSQRGVCVWLFCEFGVAISARSPAYPRSHHNLGLIMPSCFCNLNIYRAVHQHPQSSTLHLHTDKEANRAERFGINTVCHQHVLTRSWN